MATLVDANTNRLSGFGYSYDGNGNLLTMPQQSASMTYDRSNRMVKFMNLNDMMFAHKVSYQYAPDNKRVWRIKGCSYQSVVDGSTQVAPTLTFYSVFGQKLGDYCYPPSGGQVVEENVHFGGRIVAKGDAGGSLAALATDRLHSKGDGSTFFPYGETKSGTAITGDSFATYSRDWTGLDYADQRWYSPAVGRFTTVDPDKNRSPLRQRNNYYDYTDGDSINYLDVNGAQPVFVNIYIRTCYTGERKFRSPKDGDTIEKETYMKCFDGYIEVLPEADIPELTPSRGMKGVDELIAECQFQAQVDWAKSHSIIMEEFLEFTDHEMRNVGLATLGGGLGGATGGFWGFVSGLSSGFLGSLFVTLNNIHAKYTKYFKPMFDSNDKLLGQMMANCESVFLGTIQ